MAQKTKRTQRLYTDDVVTFPNGEIGIVEYVGDKYLDVIVDASNFALPRNTYTDMMIFDVRKNRVQKIGTLN